MKSIGIYLTVLVFVACSETDRNNLSVTKNPDLDKAYEYLDHGAADSAFFAFSRAKDIFIEVNDSLNTANCLINMAITQKDFGDYFGAQETALQALDYLDKSKPKHRAYLSTNYNNLGLASVKLDHYEQALTFYELAIQFSTDSLNTLIFQNNKAICYQYLSEYDKALQIYAKLQDEVKASPKEYARVLSNLARTKWLANRSYPAAAELLRSLAIRKREGDLWGLNASYVHLTDYYTKVRPDSALWYAAKMYATAKKIQSPDDQIYALSKLIELSPGGMAKDYFHTYQALSDSLSQARDAAKNQFALIRYEVEKNKADNLRLQKENAEKINRLTQQRFFTGSITFLFVFAGVIGTYWYKKRKQRFKLEAQNKIKANQLKTSRKVHDVVANGIYRVMSEIENNEDMDRDGILDKLEVVYHKSRDISYEAEGSLETEQTFAQQLAELLDSFATAGHKVLIVGNENQLWEEINENTKVEIRHVLQELMVNMRKHSGASQILVRFEKSDDILTMLYKDNGVGMKNTADKGNGLVNTVSRIKSLDGEITLCKRTGKGTRSSSQNSHTLKEEEHV